MEGVQQGDEALYKEISKSVVTVVETNDQYADHCVGIVLDNNPCNTFVMTASFLLKNKRSTLKVCFLGGEKAEQAGKAIFVGRKFGIVSVKRVQGAQPIRFRDHEARREKAMVLAPIGSFDSLTVITAFVVSPSCRGKDCKGDRVKRSDDFFAINCCYDDEGHHCKSRLTSAAVFDKSGKGLGIVYSNFGRKDPNGGVSRAINKKRVLRTRSVNHLLNKLVGKDDWRRALAENAPSSGSCMKKRKKPEG